MKQRAQFLEKIKHTLLERKSEMLAHLNEQANDKVSDGQVQDTGDEALSLSMEKLQNSIQQSEIDEIRLIENTLSRIEKGEYGVCTDCGDVISEKRLEHFLYAARCIVCQEAFEQ
ncbi:MAG: TraR/DksA family transcriptional regulator [Epsilonproteobacteria bacterium]|nr:TraR/DksA family transcriptional regulator [Campylobacterota bacterium]